ncbi:MAG: hypothetical protein RL172_2189 [Bacteroidota bacterium]
MQAQNYANHVRYVPLFHFVAAPVLLATFIGAIVNVASAINNGAGVGNALILLGLSIGLVLTWWFARSFALKAQNRAIRAEESIRYFILTGKPVDSRLRLSQLIALRFATDEELVPLSQRAIAEGLSAKQIKQAIRQWKGDYHRV